jgi:class 3 adenylate cyclase/streptogramin lyase
MVSRTALVTVMFTDIVNSTDIAAEMGDRRWRELIARHHRIVRSELRRFGGREIDTAGDGFFAAFNRPADAVRCACSIVERVRELGVEIRAGVHVGEAEVMGKGLGGMAVHTGARIAAQAGPGEVLVSGTLKDLVPGATFGFEDRGERELKGVREAPRLLAVTEVDETPVAPPMDGYEAAARRQAIAPPPAYRRRPVWIAAVVAGAVTMGLVVYVAAGGEEPATSAGPVRDAAVLVDPEEGRVRTTVPLPPGQTRGLSEGAQVAVGEGAGWVLHGYCVCRVDPDTSEVGQAQVGFPAEMSLGHRGVWVATLDEQVVPVNAGTLEASEPISFPRSGFHVSVTTTDDAVWASIGSTLYRIDPVREEVTSDPTDLVHPADDVVGMGRDVWVVDQLGKTLHRYGPDGEQISSVTLQVTPNDVVAGSEGTLWVLNRSGGTVTKVDAEGGLGQPIRVGSDATDLAVGPNGVWVADHEAQTIQRIDPELEQTDDPIRLPGPVAAVGVDQATGEVWAYLD